MKKLRNEKGSVLVLIIVVIAVLSVLGTSILAAAFSNYKMKIVNSSLKSNLYASEAGLEETYAKVYNYVVEAVKEGKIAAETHIAIYNETGFDSMKAEIENGTKTCIEFPIEKLGKPIDYNDVAYDTIVDYPFIIKYGTGTDAVYVFDREWIAAHPEEIENNTDSAFSAKFVSEFIGKITDANNGLIANGTLNEVKSDVVIRTLKPEITAILEDGKNIKDIDESYFVDVTLPNGKTTKQLVLKLTSLYQDSVTQRETEVDLVVTVPKYNEPYAVTVSRKDIPEHPLWKQALATDGTITVNSDTTVNGGVYSNTNIDVKSKFVVSNGTTKVNDRTDDKNTGNITVNGGNLLQLAGVSARNIFLEGDGAAYTGTGDMYIRDDFEMNNKRQVVNISGNYYGFEDGSSSTKGPDNSSGIIINSDDIGIDSKFTLNGNLNINGVSYIKLTDDKSYQTGESVSVKGNYLAYTMPFNTGKYNENKMTFEYIDPLMLPTKVSGNDLTVNDLKDYFMEYYNNYMNVYTPLKLSGITINGNVSTMGVSIIDTGIVNDGTGTNIIASNQNQIDDWKKSYNIATKYIGDKKLYDDAKGQITVGNDIKFGVALRDNDGALATDLNKDGLQYVNGDVIINLNNDIKSGFIISGGTVTINGNGTFRGCIIAQGGIIFNGSAKSIVYDESVVMKAFNNYKNLDEVFKKVDRDYNTIKYNSESLVETGNSGGGTNINYTSILDFKNWKIK